MTTTDDQDWLRIFGTSSNQLEPPPKPIKRRLKKHQEQAKFIKQHPELFRPPQQPQQQVLPFTDDS